MYKILGKELIAYHLAGLQLVLALHKPPFCALWTFYRHCVACNLIMFGDCMCQITRICMQIILQSCETCLDLILIRAHPSFVVNYKVRLVLLVIHLILYCISTELSCYLNLQRVL